MCPPVLNLVEGSPAPPRPGVELAAGTVPGWRVAAAALPLHPRDSQQAGGCAPAPLPPVPRGTVCCLLHSQVQVNGGGQQL